MELAHAAVPKRDIALFLDVDGTLLEIAATPHAVKVPPTLRNQLRQAAKRADGALALISGRSLQELDRLFAPCVFPAAGQHGLERRDANGKISRPGIDRKFLRQARDALTQLQARQIGLFLEDKGTSLAMHYRLAPHSKSLVQEVMRDLVAPLHDRFELRAGKCVVELAPKGYSKRLAIEAFMSELPFAHRTPVFVGDDATDEDGFAAVNALNGYAVRVGSTQATAARYCFDDVSAVISWLSDCNPDDGSWATRQQ